MELTGGWELASSPPGRCETPADIAGLDWRPARVPGTAAAAVGDDGRDFDSEDWWFRCRFSIPADLTAHPLSLQLDGIATVSEVYVDGELALESESMWASHVVKLPAMTTREHELSIACRALGPRLAKRRRPAPRWRTRVVNQSNLRWYRTMMFGRSPGFAPSPAPVGPWRPIHLTPADRPGINELRIRPAVDGEVGVVAVRLRPTDGTRAGSVSLAGRHQPLCENAEGELAAELNVVGVERWWPHTHGAPTLHELRIELEGAEPLTRRIGFRTLSWAADIPEQGLDLRVNGVPMFVRGAVWTPADLTSMAPTEAELRRLLESVRDAGMNMLRVVGTGAYESPAFHDLCDELGILVWQDLMFANMDYPISDPDFRSQVEREARDVLRRLAGRPSLAVVCGNSEIEQQPAMMGLDPALGRDQFWDDALPEIVADSEADCAYVRSTPCGGGLPFHPDRGLTHYFGVSGYFLPIADARRANVRFATECLALANVPDVVEFPVHHPLWKQGVPRDAGTGWDLGAGWDFDDVRDHYLRLLFGVDPVQLRRFDHERYLELSRLTSGEVMAEVMGEWRRSESGCQGALVLWLKDMLPGAGLGVLDHTGSPKVAYHYLRRALGPVCVWTTDEGVAGVAIHVANDRREPLSGTLRVALYRDFEARVDEASEELELAPHETLSRSVEGMLGRFVDAAWAYRFGPATADAIVVSLESRSGPSRLLSQSVRFPAGYPTARLGVDELGLRATADEERDGTVLLALRSRRVAYGVRVHASGFRPDDDTFSLEPGHERIIRLRAQERGATFAGGSLTAVNLDGQLKFAAAPG
jgi:beta-mannosidase